MTHSLTPMDALDGILEELYALNWNKIVDEEGAAQVNTYYQVLVNVINSHQKLVEALKRIDANCTAQGQCQSEKLIKDYSDIIADLVSDALNLIKSA